MKLRTQVALLLVILAVVLSGVVAAGFQLNKDSVTDQQAASVTHTSEEIAEALDARLDGLKRTVRLRATNPAIAAHGTPRQRHALQTTVNETAFHGVSVIHRNGTMTGIAAGLDADTRARLVGANFSDRRYFQQARRGETYVSSPVAAESGNYIVTISTPIYQNGTVVGTLNAALHLQNSSFFNGVTSAANDHQGVVIRSASGEVIYERAPDPSTNLITANTTVEETGWTVRTQVSRDVLAGELRTVTLYQFGAIGLVVLLVGGFGVLLYTRTLRYHDRLLDGFDNLQREDYGAQLDVDGADEWERIFTAFNDLSRTLATYEAERTEHREQLQRERDRFRTLFEGVPEPVVIVEFTEEATVLRDVNEAFETTFGYEASDAVGADINDLIVPDDERDTASTIDERAASGEQLTREVRRETTDGERDFLFRSTPLVSEGEINQQFGVYIDITERKEREKELVRQERLLDALFEFAPIHLFVKDDQYRHLWMSSALVDDPNRYIGKRDADVDGGARAEFSAEALVDDKRVINDEQRILDKEEYNETLDKWFLTSKVPWYDEDGSVAGLLGYALDITERKEREEELQRQNSRLNEFASVVSHDLRNPLNVAQGRATMLQERCDDESQEHLDSIVTSLERMESIIEDTLTLARQGDTVGEMAPIPITSLVKQCWDGVETTGATLDIADEFTIRGDRDRLRHVFENLFRNAVEHAGDDVTVRVGRAGEDRFYVEDDGTGIPADDRETVFEAGHSSATGGTGFGLTIVKRIAEAHGWEVSITDGRDGGARFEFDSVEMISE